MKSAPDRTPAQEPTGTHLAAIELAVARTLAETAKASETYDKVLAAIGSSLGWEFGAVWEIAETGAALRCVAVWQKPEVESAEFRALTETLSLAPGEGLPGRVWATGEPESIADVTVDANFPRARAAEALELRAAFCFPIRSPDAVVGTMEFFTTELHEPDEQLLASTKVLGTLIGQFVVRRRAEDAAREQDALNRAILGAALDAVITMDDGGRIIEFNAAAEQIFRYSRDEAVGRDLAELVIPEYLREAHKRGLARYLKTERGTYLDNRVELTGMRSDGSEFPVELTITRVNLPGPPTFAGFIRDITERKQAEQELRASRARVIESADTERRRLERNLHDGAQQHLVTLALKLRLAAESVSTRPETAQRLLAEARDDLASGLEELREIARGIHPALLAERGLKAALEALVERSPVKVALTELPAERLPENVEVAAYYVVAEGLTNAAKYAHAEVVSISVLSEAGMTVVQVADDGCGGADVAAGSGLRGLTDRVEALGGRLVVESPPDGGTCLRAEIPA